MRKTSVWLGPIALAVLVAAPYVGAGNGSTDTDSPYNMPALTDGGSGGGSGSGNSGGNNNNGNGNGNGGGAKSATGGTTAAVAPLTLNAKVGATIEVVPALHGGAFASIGGVKVAAAGSNAPNRSSSVVEIFALPGSNVVAVDSNPSQGDTSVEVSGKFEVRGATSLTMVTSAPYDQSNDVLIIGSTDPVTGGLSHVDSVIPLGNVGPLLDVTSVDAALATQPLLAGKTAVIALGQTEAAVDGTAHTKFAAVVQFRIAATTTFHVDTAPHLP
jgi:hypothetical protein